MTPFVVSRIFMTVEFDFCWLSSVEGGFGVVVVVVVVEVVVFSTKVIKFLLKQIWSIHKRQQTSSLQTTSGDAHLHLTLIHKILKVRSIHRSRWTHDSLEYDITNTISVVVKL